jgi:hypothetical protein
MKEQSNLIAQEYGRVFPELKDWCVAHIQTALEYFFKEQNKVVHQVGYVKEVWQEAVAVRSKYVMDFLQDILQFYEVENGCTGIGL